MFAVINVYADGIGTLAFGYLKSQELEVLSSSVLRNDLSGSHKLNFSKDPMFNASLLHKLPVNNYLWASLMRNDLL